MYVTTCTSCQVNKPWNSTGKGPLQPIGPSGRGSWCESREARIKGGGGHRLGEEEEDALRMQGGEARGEDRRGGRER
eukprot:2354392-Rhodomonas_salina.1